jgi:cell division protein ZapE
MDGSAAASPTGPLPAYRALLASGVLMADDSQLAAAERLQDLFAKLRGYNPSPRAGGVISRLLRLRPAEGAPDSRANGLYLAGEVGRGKSMLMDLFFQQADVARKRRIHFHQFMAEVHGSIHAWKLANPDGADPIPPLADNIAAETALLCFDEFQVNDIADAMILGRLFSALFERGVVVVATSNTRPDQLFAGRPGRDAFLPFIALLKQKLDLLLLEGDRDYRRDRLHGMRTWHIPPDEAASRALDRAFAALAGGALPGPRKLLVMGRTFQVPLAAGSVARFDFAALCAQALGAGDYPLDALVLATPSGPRHFDVYRAGAGAGRHTPMTWPWPPTSMPWCWTLYPVWAPTISTKRGGLPCWWTRSTSTG